MSETTFFFASASVFFIVFLFLMLNLIHYTRLRYSRWVAEACGTFCTVAIFAVFAALLVMSVAAPYDAGWVDLDTATRSLNIASAIAGPALLIMTYINRSITKKS